MATVCTELYELNTALSSLLLQPPLAHVVHSVCITAASHCRQPTGVFLGAELFRFGLLMRSETVFFENRHLYCCTACVLRVFLLFECGVSNKIEILILIIID